MLINHTGYELDALGSNTDRNATICATQKTNLLSTENKYTRK
jgi:hypothetical protein